MAKKMSASFSAIKVEVDRKANDLIDKILKPRFVEPPSEVVRFN